MKYTKRISNISAANQAIEDMRKDKLRLVHFVHINPTTFCNEILPKFTVINVY